MAVANATRLSTLNEEVAAHLQELSTKWQPISTAPTSGTIRLWWRNAGEGAGSFAVDEEWTPGSPSPRDGWKCEGDDAIPRNQEDCTHWMLQSLPPPGQRFPNFSGLNSEQDNLRSALTLRFHLDRARK